MSKSKICLAGEEINWKAGEAKTAVFDTAENAKDKLAKGARQVKDNVADTAGNAKENLVKGAENIKDGVGNGK